MKYSLVFVFILWVFAPSFTYAQDIEMEDEVNKDELTDVTDEFQELFFKALKLRAIEKNEQAIEALNQCIALDKEEAAVYVELAKNYTALENFLQAEKHYTKAIELLDNEAKLQTQAHLFEVLKSQKKYSQSADLAQKMIEAGKDFAIELTEIYMAMGKYSKAIEEIEKLESKKGYTTLTDNFRDAIYKSTKDFDAAVAFYEKRIEENPLDEDNYFRLISFYKAQENNQAILRTAEALEQINPLQDELPFILSMVYIEENKPEEAFAYSQKVLANASLDERVKTQLIQALKEFVNEHPSYQNDFIQLLDLAIEEGESSASNRERAEFYLNRDVAKSLSYYQKALVDQPNSFELHQKVIVLQLKQKLYQDALVSTQNALEVFPAQAVFYYFKGKALLGLVQYDKAILVLEEALDYIFETSQLEVDIYNELSRVYFQKGNNDKTEEYSKKAQHAKQNLEEQD